MILTVVGPPLLGPKQTQMPFCVYTYKQGEGGNKDKKGRGGETRVRRCVRVHATSSFERIYLIFTSVLSPSRSTLRTTSPPFRILIFISLSAMLISSWMRSPAPVVPNG